MSTYHEPIDAESSDQFPGGKHPASTAKLTGEPDVQAAFEQHFEPAQPSRVSWVTVLIAVLILALGGAVYAYQANKGTTPSTDNNPVAASVTPTAQPDTSDSSVCKAAATVGMSEEVYQKLAAASQSNNEQLCNEAALQAIVSNNPTKEAQLMYVAQLSVAASVADDQVRASRLRILQVQLKAYLDKTGGYPTAAQLSSDAWLQENMPIVREKNAHLKPGQTDNSIKSDSEPSSQYYVYSALDTLGEPCKQAPCASYVISVKNSVDGAVLSVKSSDPV